MSKGGGNMNKAKIKDILIRCLKTLIQGFLATLLVSMKNGSLELTKSALIGALAGGISALMNLIIKILEPNNAYLEESVEYNELSEQNNDTGGNK